MNRSLRACVIAAFLMWMMGCTTPPSRMDWLAQNQLEEGVVDTALFPLWTLSNSAYRYRTGRRLVVLLDGDGLPWTRPDLEVADPTPPEPLLLPLLSQVNGAAVYLGRPCYHQAPLDALGRAVADDCKPYWWTFGRYSELVVTSLAEAVRTLAKDYDEVVLLGHGGGGTLAVLIAPELNDLSRLRVVTWAANLDVGAWTRAHGHAPLSASLDPMTRPPLDERVEQTHVAGGKDKVLQASWIEAYAQRQPNARFVREAGFDYRCCWREQAKRLLPALD